jgi:hypothetical protein
MQEEFEDNTGVIKIRKAKMVANRNTIDLMKK